jgi:DNA (cytosine-5)-methyltransferase 1
MLDCVDVYCGAGGLSLGLSLSGLNVRAAVDASADCKVTYERNLPGIRFHQKRLEDVPLDELFSQVPDPTRCVLAGGPPCQLFSRLNRNAKGKPHGLRPYVGVVQWALPAYVVFENVPAIRRRTAAWSYLLKSLRDLGYVVTFGVLRAVDFGVPQQRRRMIVIASREKVALPQPRSKRVRTVRDAIGSFPDQNPRLTNHEGLTLGADNLQRIRSLCPGESSRSKDSSFCDSYARMSWDQPAPTITTKCISFSNGRFGHPEYDRAITIREAAVLQGFPVGYKFHGSLWSRARQVGNAVPPPIARALGEVIVAHALTLDQTKAA